MAKSDNPETAEKPAPEAPAPAQRPQQQVQLDESKAIACYANFCRVTGTPEELILDFGLNSQPFGDQNEPVAINQRVVMNFYTAKRLLNALHFAVNRHESFFGALEVDVQRRLRNQPSAPRPGGFTS